MIRIEENTFIDDTLVTCAEYQLFIDEMRQQGKYRQPDHWTSNQFPRGQAHSPIVGVYFSDAKAFCDWLTQREAGEWSFRLPTSAEAEKYPLKNPDQIPLGYWTTGSNGEAQFAWVDPAPVNPRNLNSDLDHTLASDLDSDRNSDLDHAFDLARASALSRALGRDRNDDDLSRKLRFIRIRLNQAIYKRDNAADLDSTTARDITLVKDRRNALNQALGNSVDLDKYLDCYIDIYTFEERIAGRSPAFEGIRLVKERVK